MFCVWFENALFSTHLYLNKWIDVSVQNAHIHDWQTTETYTTVCRMPNKLHASLNGRQRSLLCHFDSFIRKVCDFNYWTLIIWSHFKKAFWMKSNGILPIWKETPIFLLFNFQFGFMLVLTNIIFFLFYLSEFSVYVKTISKQQLKIKENKTTQQKSSILIANVIAIEYCTVLCGSPIAQH